MAESSLPKRILSLFSLVLDISNYEEAFGIVEIVVTQIDFLDGFVFIEAFYQAFQVRNVIQTAIDK
jgi:hypothetical protein